MTAGDFATLSHACWIETFTGVEVRREGTWISGVEVRREGTWISEDTAAARAAAYLSNFGETVAVHGGREGYGGGGVDAIRAGE